MTGEGWKSELIQPATRPEQGMLPHDSYPVVRVGGEFFMRAIDLMAQAQDDSIIRGLIFMTLWHEHLRGEGNAISMRELARRFGLAYETIRRHATELVRNHQCEKTDHGMIVPRRVLDQPQNVELLRKLCNETIRLISDLIRIGAASGTWGTARTIDQDLSSEQMAIARAGMGATLAAVKMSLDYIDHDLLKGIVHSAIWTANIKHVTNASIPISGVLPDEMRRPVSVMAVANSLRLPYETTRRYAAALVKEGICVRVGRQGIVVPASVHERSTDATVRGYGIVQELLTELRQAGIKV